MPSSLVWVISGALYGPQARAERENQGCCEKKRNMVRASSGYAQQRASPSLLSTDIQDSEFVYTNNANLADTPGFHVPCPRAVSTSYTPLRTGGTAQEDDMDPTMHTPSSRRRARHGLPSRRSSPRQAPCGLLRPRPRCSRRGSEQLGVPAGRREPGGRRRPDPRRRRGPGRAEPADQQRRDHPRRGRRQAGPPHRRGLAHEQASLGRRPAVNLTGPFLCTRPSPHAASRTTSRTPSSSTFPPSAGTATTARATTPPKAGLAPTPCPGRSSRYPSGSVPSHPASSGLPWWMLPPAHWRRSRRGSSEADALKTSGRPCSSSSATTSRVASP